MDDSKSFLNILPRVKAIIRGPSSSDPACFWQGGREPNPILCKNIGIFAFVFGTLYCFCEADLFCISQGANELKYTKALEDSSHLASTVCLEISIQNIQKLTKATLVREAL